MCGDYLFSGFMDFFFFINLKEGRVYQTPFAFLILVFLKRRCCSNLLFFFFFVIYEPHLLLPVTLLFR
jgi:hypothetical protein